MGGNILGEKFLGGNFLGGVQYFPYEQYHKNVQKIKRKKCW